MTKEIQQNIVDLLKNDFNNMVGETDQEKIKLAAENMLKGLMEGPGQIISNYKVEIVEESPEIQIIRAVMEEPNDTINLVITVQQPPINYIEHTFNVGPDTDLDKIDEVIKELNDESDNK